MSPTASRGNPSQTPEKSGVPLMHLPQGHQDQVQKLVSAGVGTTTPTHFVPSAPHEKGVKGCFPGTPSPKCPFRPPEPGHALPVHHHCVFHVLEQLLGLKQEGDVQNHVAIPWGEDGNSQVQFCKGTRKDACDQALPRRVPQQMGDLPRTDIP